MPATIPLAHQKFEPNKLLYPVLLSEKADGVPVRMDAIADFAISRQGKPVPSVQRLLDTFKRAVQSHPSNVISITGEIVDRKTFHQVMAGSEQPRTPFKDISGHVRRQEVDEDLCMIVFDADFGDGRGWAARMSEAAAILDWCKGFMCIDRSLTCEIVTTSEECEAMAEYMLQGLPTAEGLIARSVSAPWEPNSRSAKHYQKIVKDPTIDLEVVGMEEAIAEDGTPKGMVGAFLVRYKGSVVKAGAGKLTHKERTELWQKGVNAFNSNIAEIKYKRDDSYEALRQPTFQRWRDDKETPDA